VRCQVVTFPSGGRGFVCGPRPPRRRCKCGAAAARECDWKVKARRSGTCDAPLCVACTTVPSPDKDLCPKHAEEWKARLQGPPLGPLFEARP
jgi:hypothetical protein